MLSKGWRLAFLVGVIALGVLVAVACGGDEDETPAAQVGGEIVVHATEPEFLDPHISDFNLDITIEQMIYRGLYDLLPGGVMSPAYADGLPDVSDDGLVYTIKIKDGMKWGDGETLDANDFVFGIQRTCNPDVAGHYQYILTNLAGCDDYYAATDSSDEDKTGLQNLVGVRATDDLTLEITLANPQPTFQSLLALWPTYPAPDEMLASVDADWPDPPETPCNGPFCATELAVGDHLTL